MSRYIDEHRGRFGVEPIRDAVLGEDRVHTVLTAERIRVSVSVAR